VVLSGGYEEAGFAGRFDLNAGDVAVHSSFDAHLDRVQPNGCELLNLPLARGTSLPAAFKVADPDLIARIAERDPHLAARALVPSQFVTVSRDWPDELASAITHTPQLVLGRWANIKGLAAETVSRGFRTVFGVTPARFRLEMQAQRAIHLIEESGLSLAEIAAECGFSDQPHLTRAFVQLTGRAPGAWRRESIPFKTDVRCRA
jgi:AraC-like DNA-binding protein